VSCCAPSMASDLASLATARPSASGRAPKPADDPYDGAADNQKGDRGREDVGHQVPELHFAWFEREDVGVERRPRYRKNAPGTHEARRVHDSPPTIGRSGPLPTPTCSGAI